MCGTEDVHTGDLNGAFAAERSGISRQPSRKQDPAAVSQSGAFYFPEPFDRWVRRSLAERLQITAIFGSSLDRRRREYKRMGWIYAMRNPALKENVFEVGMELPPRRRRH